ncbi:MAG: pyruvate formate lyase family protein, partial [Spirochaetaceae bacterium]|nr:pyruvate formate lyase family protein [Spirochaetaceae bacterium]
MDCSFRMAARPVPLPEGFWELSIAERRAWFVKEVMVKHLPRDFLPGDLLVGARFNIQTSLCLTKEEDREWRRTVLGKRGARKVAVDFHNHGYGNAGATSGHLVPGYERALKIGWRGIHDDLQERYAKLTEGERDGSRGRQLRAMITSSTMARDLAAAYAADARALAARELGAAREGGATREGDATRESGAVRAAELEALASILDRVPWEPARDFREAVQALWLTHMLVMADENYPGPGVSFGRVDQYLLPYWEASKAKGMTRAEAKEILGCLWFHCNTAYDAQIRTGNNGITAGFGQLITLSGLGAGPGGEPVDLTNELTMLFLEVIDEMSPILEPKPNVRIHRDSPDALMEKVVSMIEASQGAPFLLNFDERSLAGMMRESREGGLGKLITEANVYDYAPVGCLENTMVGNDRSGTVDCNVNLLKAVELALTGGRDLLPFRDAMSGRVEEPRQAGPRTGDAASFASWDEFWRAYEEQTRYIARRIAGVYEASETVRSRLFPTPYLSCLVGGCAESGLDVNQGGAEISLVTLEAVTYATTVDSLLAVKHLVFDRKECAMAELIQALRDNWKGHEALRAMALHKAPKYGRDDPEADALAKAVMDLWCAETWKLRTASTGRRFRPGMLSWNYWAGDGFVMAASAD